MSVTKKMKSEGLKLGMKAMSKIMEDPERAGKLMRAVQTVQQGREHLDEATHRMWNLGQLPSGDDVREMSRRAGRLRRKAKKILAALDKIEAS